MSGWFPARNHKSWVSDGLAWRCVNLNNYHGKHCTEAVSYCPRTEVGLTLSGPRRSVKWHSLHQQKSGKKLVESFKIVHSSASKIRRSITKFPFKKTVCSSIIFSSHLSEIRQNRVQTWWKWYQLGIKPDKNCPHSFEDFLLIAINGLHGRNISPVLVGKYCPIFRFHTMFHKYVYLRIQYIFNRWFCPDFWTEENLFTPLGAQEVSHVFQLRTWCGARLSLTHANITSLAHAYVTCTCKSFHYVTCTCTHLLVGVGGVGGMITLLGLAHILECGWWVGRVGSSFFTSNVK